jgi:hypothetical protein
MKTLKGVLIACLLSVAGCVTEAERQQDLATYGTAPMQYEAKIKDYFKANLPHSQSVRYLKISAPMKCHASKNGAEYTDGWCSTATIDTLKEDGKSAGWKDYSFVFRGEDLLFVVLRDYKATR